MKINSLLTVFAVLIGLVWAFNAGAAPEAHAIGSLAMTIDPMALAFAGIVGSEALEPVMKALDGLEAKLASFSNKADEEFKAAGSVSAETKSALEALGIKQREMADEILLLKQKGVADGRADNHNDSAGQLFIKSDEYKHVMGKIAVGSRGVSAGVEVKNTITNTVGATHAEPRPGVIGGAFREFTLEALLGSLPTAASSVDYVVENVFTNAAAETAEGALKPEASITFTPANVPMATIAHWLKISKQLAADNRALAAYVDTRLIYGVNLRVENQIIQGNGTAPNMSGFTRSGNFTPHGYTAANLTSAGLLNNRFDLIGKIIGDLKAADYNADAIVLNPTDWWTIRLAKDSQNRYILGDPGQVIAPSLFGVPVVASNAVTADNVLVGSLAQAATFYDRESVTIQMSDSDTDNFTRNLITILAERRCALAVERPAAVRYGDLTPA